MMRHCDGTDPYLIRPDRSAEADCPHTDENDADCICTAPIKWRACDCGKRFDDVNTTVTYPHRRF